MDYVFPLPLDGQLGYSLYSAFMAVSRTYKPWLDRLGITYPQYLVMCVLWEGDNQTITAIATLWCPSDPGVGDRQTVPDSSFYDPGPFAMSYSSYSGSLGAWAMHPKYNALMNGPFVVG